MSKTEDSASSVSEGNPESLNNHRGDVIPQIEPGRIGGMEESPSHIPGAAPGYGVNWTSPNQSGSGPGYGASNSYPTYGP